MSAMTLLGAWSPRRRCACATQHRVGNAASERVPPDGTTNVLGTGSSAPDTLGPSEPTVVIWT